MAVLRILLVALVLFALQVAAVGIDVNNSPFGSIYTQFRSGANGANESVVVTFTAVPNATLFAEVAIVGGTHRLVDSPLTVTLFGGPNAGASLISYDANGIPTQEATQCFPPFLNAFQPFSIAIDKLANSWTIRVSQAAYSVTWLFPFALNPPISHAQNVILFGTVELTYISLVPDGYETFASYPITTFNAGEKIVFNFTNNAVEFCLGGVYTPIPKNQPLYVTISGFWMYFSMYDNTGLPLVTSAKNYFEYLTPLSWYLVTVTHDTTYWYVTIEQNYTQHNTATFSWPFFTNVNSSLAQNIGFKSLLLNSISFE